MTQVRYDTLIGRIRHDLMDDRISTESEADAEINMMTNVELVEVISNTLWTMLTEIEDGIGVAFKKTPPDLGPQADAATS